MSQNPERAQSGWPRAVVAGAYQTGVNLMRDLVRRGVDAVCFDCVPSQPGFKSVYGKAYLCPDPDLDPQAWLAFMVKLATDLGGRPALLSSSDKFVTAIGRFGAELEPHFLFPSEALPLQEALATKQQQYDIAGRAGFPIPLTRFVRSLDEVRAFAAAATFPCLLKPNHFREWERFPEGHPLLNQKVVVSPDAAHMLECYELAASVTPELMAQEIIDGPDEAKLVYLSCYARAGQRLGSCIVRQLRTTPIHFGSASIVEPETDAATDEICDRFLRSVGYAGLCELELKRDTRDGKVKLIEVNPRYSVTADAALYAGVDLGWLHYLDLIGQPVEPVAPSPRPFRHIFLGRDFASYREYLQAGLLTRPRLIWSYRPPVAFFDFDLRDWHVTLDTIIKCGKIFCYPLYRRLARK